MNLARKIINQKKKIIAFFLVSILFVLILEIKFSLAKEPFSSFTNGLKNTAQTGAGYSEAAAKNPAAYFSKILGTFLFPAFTGVIGMILLSYGGYIWMSSRGDEQKVEKAKSIITNTLFALVIIYSAFAIVNIVISLWGFWEED